MDPVVFFEIPFDDMDKCKQFYEKLFHWEFLEAGHYMYVRSTEVDDNLIVRRPGAINGMMYKRGAQNSQNPVLVIDVLNMDEKLKQVEKEGGEIVKNKILMDDGWHAQIRDTERNIIGLWQKGQE